MTVQSLQSLSWMRQALGVILALLAVVATVWAQATDRFTATTANMDPAGEDLRIDLLGWSSDDERQAVLAVIMNPDATPGEGGELAELLELPTIGYIWPSGSGLGYSVKYAHRVETPNGGEHLTLVTGRRLGTFGRAPWRPTDAPPTPLRPFTVIELRLNGAGEGEGKFSAGTEIVFDQEHQTVALSDYEAQPVLLESVRRQAPRYSGD